MAKRDLISVSDMQDEWPALVDLAIKLKAERGHHGDPLKGKTLAMIFEKPSTRTRISLMSRSPSSAVTLSTSTSPRCRWVSTARQSRTPPGS